MRERIACPTAARILFTRGLGYEWLTVVWGMEVWSRAGGEPPSGVLGYPGASPSRHTPSGAQKGTHRIYTPCLRRRAPPSFPLPPSRSP
eukprot:5965856-Prymnesium_polylepis.1